MDEINLSYYLKFSGQRWLSIRLDTIRNLLVFTTGIYDVTSRPASPALFPLLLSLGHCPDDSKHLAPSCWNGECHERHRAPALLWHRARRRNPPSTYLGPVVLAPKWWSSNALPLVLHSLNLTVAGGERIGVVGLTGAGKPSIISALFWHVAWSWGADTI